MSMRDPQRAGVAALIALTCSGAVVAADPDPFVKGPYLQNVTRSSVTVMWESAVETRGQVTVLTDPPMTVDSELAQIHEVVIDGLEPGRRYRYRVRAGSGERVGELATAPESDAPYSFIVFGDSRSNAAAHRRVVERIRREVPDFLLNTGDMVNEGASAGDWQQFFDIEREILAENVLYPSVGNHDRQGRGRTADNYRKYFSLPENSPDPERYYAFTYGNSRFLILDSNAYSFALTDQTAWIEEQLQAARLDPAIAHIFVTMHHPPYSISLHGGHAELREAWTPLYEKYQVAAVFSGHDHVYSRAETGGVRYFVSGGGGAPLYPRRSGRALDERATVYFERVNHYIRVHVIGGAIEVSAFRADGTLIEALSWGKRLPEPERARRIAALGRVEPGPVDPTRAARPPDVADDPRIAAASPGDPARFGWRGIVGLLLAIGGGLVLVRAARG
jgi:hypothetical protein